MITPQSLPVSDWMTTNGYIFSTTTLDRVEGFFGVYWLTYFLTPFVKLASR